MATTATPSPPRRWVVSHSQLAVAVASLLFIVLSQVRGLHLFNGDDTDGFFSQIKYVSILLATGKLNILAEPVLGVHILRFVIVSPWYFSWLQGMPSWFEALLMAPVLLTVATARFHGRIHLIQLVVFLLPFALSYRTVLVIVGIANLYIYLFSDRRRGWQFYVSAAMSFLSSGVALAWFMIILMNLPSVKKMRIGLYLSLALGFAGLVAAVKNKLGFFGSGTADYARGTGLSAALERNTILVSYMVNDKMRFFLYIGILALVVWFLVALNSLGRPARPLMWFFSAAAVAFLFEGLGAIAFLMPVLWCLAGCAVLPETGSAELKPA